MSEQSQSQSTPDPTDGPQRTVEWVLHDADWLVTCDDAMRCVRGGAVAIDRGVLVGVGETSIIRSRFCGLREVDLRGCLAMPGLINTHTHAAMSLFRGLADDLPLDRWLHDVIIPAEAAVVGPEMVYWGTVLAAVEMLRNGITTFCDGYFFEDAAARAALDVGMRAVLGQGILDFPSPDEPNPAKARDRAEAFLASFPESDRIRASLFCHAPYTCGPETLGWVKDLCRSQGVLFQIHLSETRGEVSRLTEQTGMSPAAYLDSLGILDRDTLCAHGVWLNPEEIQLLADRNVGISHNPESNMKLASGIAPVPDLLTSGIRVGLGTDGCASNNDLDLFSEMDRAAKLHKVSRNDPTVCRASEVLAMATLDGARTIGWGDAIGSLEVGKQADLITIDLMQPHLTPLYDPVSHLVYCAKGSDVRMVWVGGRVVVDNRMILTAEIPAVYRELQRILGAMPDLPASANLRVHGPTVKS